MMSELTLQQVSYRYPGGSRYALDGISGTFSAGKLYAVIGPSGSGKSTLAFRIVFAEGQRRYIDNLSAYARSRIQPPPIPDYDSIRGIPPTVSIEQRTSRGGWRSTAATMTEIYHYARLLFARLGEKKVGRGFVRLHDADPRLFSYNTKLGACPKCLGYGFVSQSVEKAKRNDDKENAYANELAPAARDRDVRVVCPACEGKRLSEAALAVHWQGITIADFSAMTVKEALAFCRNLSLDEHDAAVAQEALKEIVARLAFLDEVGLGYLELDRAAPTLSGGEAQRIRLATQINSTLRGVCYVLDEPTIGLHPRDNRVLIDALKRLCRLGNTLLVVEHDEDTIRAADHLIDIGPGAGEHGGEVVAIGTAEEIMKNEKSITGAYLSGRIQIPVPSERRKPAGWLTVKGAAENNLKNIDVKFPLGVMTCVTGVSGSGKSSLVNEILYKALAKKLNRAHTIPGKHKSIEGVEQLDKIIAIDQSPIGRTPRSNPATYTGAFDLIRDLFAASTDAKAKGYNKGRFSFNKKGGRCEACSGDGIIKIEMHFLPDIYVPCEVCGGKRYNRETLEVKYKGKSIYDVLNMTVEEAMNFFENVPSIHRKIATLYDVGLSYIRLGQPSTELSGGEAQRIKLATELSKRGTGKTIYILDEPTTGLHFADVHRLIEILRRLSDGGNTVVVIEHNLDVIKTADYLIDIGPEGGEGGGTVIAKGTPEEVAATPGSYTGKYVKKYLNV